jgi:hypothetical protein
MPLSSLSRHQQKKMIFLLLLSTVVARFGFSSYSALVTWHQSDGSVANGIVSMSPDPITGALQPRIALNLTASGTATVRWTIGGIRSVIGGVATLPQIGYTAGDLRLEAFDFSAGGWAATTANASATFAIACTRSFWCPWLVRGSLLDVVTNGTLTMRTDARGTPLLLVVSAADGAFLSISVDAFAADALVFQPDDSVYRLPAVYFVGARVRQPVVARTLSMIRSFNNDSYARLLANDDLADATGEAYHACSSPARPLAIYAEFRVLVDVANLADYTPCKRGLCACSTSSVAGCQSVGVATAHGTWFSLPVSAMCPIGFALGTNNCTWSANYTLVRAVAAQCLLTIPDPLFPHGFTLSACTNNTVNVGKHIQFALDHCPPVVVASPF